MRSHYGKTGTLSIYAPEGALELIEQLIKTNIALDRFQTQDKKLKDPKYKLIASETLVKTPVKVRSGKYVYATPVTHRVPAFGYYVICRVNKLKDEYINLGSSAIRDLAKSGTVISEIVNKYMFGYTGDTTIRSLIANQHLLNVPILITECTFLSPEHKGLAKSTQHIHALDVASHIGLFKAETIILMHISPRYKLEEIHEIIQKNIVPSMRVDQHLTLCSCYTG